MTGNDKLLKEATDLLNSMAVMPSYASNLISRLQTALIAEQNRANKQVSSVQYEEACRLLRERTGQLSDMEAKVERVEAALRQVKQVVDIRGYEGLS